MYSTSSKVDSHNVFVSNSYPRRRLPCWKYDDKFARVDNSQWCLLTGWRPLRLVCYFCSALSLCDWTNYTVKWRARFSQAISGPVIQTSVSAVHGACYLRNNLFKFPNFLLLTLHQRLNWPRDTFQSVTLKSPKMAQYLKIGLFAKIFNQKSQFKFRSCVKVEVAVLGSPS